MTETEEMQDKIKRLETINFTITKCSPDVYHEFKTFCQEETNDNYSMGLKLLLEARNANIKEAVLFEQYQELKERIDALENAKSETKKKPKTMGSD